MRFHVKALVLGFALVGLAACGGDDGGGSGSGGGGATPVEGGGGAAGGGGGGGAAYDAAASTGSVSGSVKFSGENPPAALLPIAGDAFCMGAFTGEKKPVDERFVVNADGTVPNVFVWAHKGPHTSLTGYEAPTGFNVHQHDCYYVPHVFGVMVGQEFTVSNDDQTTHNVHIKPKRNDDVNKGQAPGAKDVFTLDKKESKIPFSCDVHSWMSAWAFALDHPFFATTDASGKFTVKGLPDGEYEFKAWHETLQDKPFKSFKVTISGGAATTADVTLDGK